VTTNDSNNMGISKPLGLLQLVMDRIRRTLHLHNDKRKDKPMDPKVRKDSEKMTDIEKMDQGFNGDTFSLNGRDVDF
tara:strand:- start:7128 stop:7358 length:231 start_codon:yes stop_codon:yes gene_type:complete